MKSKTLLLGVTLAAVLALSMFTIQDVDAKKKNSLKHLDIKSVSLVEEGDGTATAELEIKKAIPKNGKKGAFGYGLITDLFDTGRVDVDNNPILVPENVLAITSHICVADSFEQSDINEAKKCENGQTVGLLTALGLGIDTEHDGPEIHPHILDLVDVQAGSACEGISDIEVNAEKTIFVDGDNVSPSTYDLKIKGNKVTVGNIPIDGGNLHNANLAAYASFNIVGIASTGTITNLCLVDLTVTPVE